MNPTPAPTDEEIAERSLQFVGLEPLTDFDYIGFARSFIAPSPIQPAVGGAEDDLADRAATLFERAIRAGFAPADAQIAALTAALASTSPAQTGGVDQAWIETAKRLFREAGPIYSYEPFLTHLSTALGAAKKE